MMLKGIKDQLEQRWGPFSEEENCLCNGTTAYLDPARKFNYIFKPLSKKLFEEYAVSNGVVIPDELLALYAECNGMRLFLSSFSIYGLQERRFEIEPFDLAIENQNNHSRLHGLMDEYFFFGAFGRDFVFAYNLRKANEVKCIALETGAEVISFDSLSALFEYFIPRIAKLYDSNCRKINPDKEFEGIPALENVTSKLDEII